MTARAFCPEHGTFAPAAARCPVCGGVTAPRTRRTTRIVRAQNARAKLAQRVALAERQGLEFVAVPIAELRAVVASSGAALAELMRANLADGGRG